VKKRSMLVALMFAFSVQFLHAQQRTQSSLMQICPVDDPCDPTPTPTPTATPTPIPTPTPDSGIIGPKYIVLTVDYAPPGSKSFVTYSNSTMQGTGISLTNSFTNDTTVSVSFTKGFHLPIFGHLGVDFTSNSSTEFTQAFDTSSSLAIEETTTRSTTVPGPLDDSIGVDHDQDIILVWLNPQLELTFNTPTDISWTGVSFDMNDPSHNMEVLGIPVKFLNGHETTPQSYNDVFARRWAPNIACDSSDPECGPNGTKGPGLTANDLAAILAADPFADPAYVIDIPANSICTADSRFCLAAGQSFQYSPPADGGQPLTQRFQLDHVTTATQGQTATDTRKVSFSSEFAATSGFLFKLKSKLTISDALTFTNKWSTTDTEKVGQTSLLSVTGPTAAANYQGPIEFNVFQDNVYGTFMFGFIPPPTFNLFVSPTSQSVSVSNCVDYTVNVGALVSGFNKTVSLSVSAGLPQGVTVTFNPPSVTGAGSSNMHVCAAPSAPLSTSTLTIRGVVGIEAHTATAGLVVTDFTLGATPSSQSVVVGGTASYTVSMTALNGFSGGVNLSICGGVPAGATSTFTPASITGSGSSTLTITTSAATPVGTYTICISGVSGSLTHTTSVSLTVGSAPAGDFTLSATPGSQTVNAGDSAFYTVSTSALNGFNGTVTLSASGPGGDIFVDLSPGSITGAGSASLSVSTSSTTSAGTYFISITGTSGSLSHSTSVSITVNSSGGCLDRGICPVQ